MVIVRHVYDLQLRDLGKHLALVGEQASACWPMPVTLSGLVLLKRSSVGEDSVPAWIAQTEVPRGNPSRPGWP